MSVDALMIKAVTGLHVNESATRPKPPIFPWMPAFIASLPPELKLKYRIHHEELAERQRVMDADLEMFRAKLKQRFLLSTGVHLERFDCEADRELDNVNTEARNVGREPVLGTTNPCHESIGENLAPPVESDVRCSAEVVPRSQTVVHRDADSVQSHVSPSDVPVTDCNSDAILSDIATCVLDELPSISSALFDEPSELVNDNSLLLAHVNLAMSTNCHAECCNDDLSQDTCFVQSVLPPAQIEVDDDHECCRTGLCDLGKCQCLTMNELKLLARPTAVNCSCELLYDSSQTFHIIVVGYCWLECASLHLLQSIIVSGSESTCGVLVLESQNTFLYVTDGDTHAPWDPGILDPFSYLNARLENFGFGMLKAIGMCLHWE